MKSKLNILILLLISILFHGCEKYVNIKTQGKTVPGEIRNYRYLLNYTSAYEVGPRMCDLASDDLGLVDGSTQQLALNSDPYAYWYKNYTWQAPIYPLGSYQTDYDWNSMYNTIAYCNVIINEVPAVTNGTEADKNALIAEALVHRADAYLMLLNSYAKPYNATTASSDLGVPLVLVQTTTQPLIRESVQRIYEQIISDLKKALFSLPATQLFNTLPSKPSAYGELARCYLSMNDYSTASIYADSALLTRSTLNDMSSMTTISTYPLRKSDPEILLSKIAYGGISTNTPPPSALRLSDDLLNLLGTSDKRYLLFTAAASIISSTYTTAGGRFFYRDKALNESRSIGPSVPEMMLIKAEYYARKNDVANAMIWVNKIRAKRFATSDYIPLTASDKDDALVKVIQERHREFFCRMLRWWDMRRLKDEALFKKTYQRTFGGKAYLLESSSNRYVFPIADYLIQLNTELVQNP